MHAFLLIGANNLQQTTTDLAKKLKAKIMEYPLQKIEDVRNLNNLVRLSFDEPTLVVCSDIHTATEEALNAFLKNLEEPQENIYFALTSPSIRKVLPTIASRCQIIKIRNTNIEIRNEKETEEFLAMTVGEKLNYISQIKDRDRAIELAENSVSFLHSQLHSDRVKYDVTVNNIEAAMKTLSGLNANGNVNLQLTNFVINYQNG